MEFQLIQYEECNEKQIEQECSRKILFTKKHLNRLGERYI